MIEEPKETQEQDVALADENTPEEDSSTSNDVQLDESEENAEAGDDQQKKSETQDTEDEPNEDSKDPRDLAFRKGYNQAKAKFDKSMELEELRAEYEERENLLKNPDVYEAVLRSQGITDKNVIAQKMQEVGLQPKIESNKAELFKQFTEGVDLNSQEGWLEAMWRMSQAIANQTVTPLKQSISNREKTEIIAKWESEAKELSKTFDIEYGQNGKSENDPNTAIGKIASYIRKNPKDAGLGHAKILRLAMSEEGYKMGEQKGIKKEKNRNESLKRSQMEDDNKVSRKKEPTADASIKELMDYAAENDV